MNCLSVFDLFVELALEGLIRLSSKKKENGKYQKKV